MKTNKKGVEHETIHIEKRGKVILRMCGTVVRGYFKTFPTSGNRNPWAVVNNIQMPRPGNPEKS